MVERTLKKRKAVFVTGLSLIFMIITLWAATVFFDENRIFYFVSLLVICYILITFFVCVERKRPRTSEVVIITALVTLAVVSRAAFFMLPQVKPVVAVVVVSAACLGARLGFLIGALTAFVSNFIFGQGPWTPWQMFALGMTGLIAGAVLCNHKALKKPIPLAVVGAVCTFVVYGGLVDLWTVFGFNPEPTLGTAVTIYLSAIPFNGILAVATAAFLYFLGVPFIEKIERVKYKYGIFSQIGEL